MNSRWLLRGVAIFDESLEPATIGRRNTDMDFPVPPTIFLQVLRPPDLSPGP